MNASSKFLVFFRKKPFLGGSKKQEGYNFINNTFFSTPKASPFFIFSLVSFFQIFSSSDAVAQRIRKDYREMTTQEKTNYRNAINQLNNNSLSTALNPYNNSGRIEANRAIHNVNNGQHGTQAFFPWHRQFLYNFETELLGKNPKVTLPYWDWRFDRTAANASFWGTDANFLQPFNTSWALGRSAMTATWLPTEAEVASNQGQTVFATFISNSESTHGSAHVWVGGNMGGVSTSPRDPSFYLHHTFVDYLWQVWEDKTAGVQSNFTSTNTNPVQPYNVSGNSLINSRTKKVWYAKHNETTGSGKLVLDGFNGANYIVSGTENYRYTGEIQATTFIVPSGTTCNFVTSGRISADVITLSKGFHAQAGSSFSARKDANYFNTARVGDDEIAFNETEENGEIAENEIYLFEENATLEINFVVPNGSHINQLGMYDMAGRKVATISEEESAQTNYKVELSSLPEGMYFVSALVDNQLKSKKFIHKK